MKAVRHQGENRDFGTGLEPVGVLPDISEQRGNRPPEQQRGTPRCPAEKTDKAVLELLPADRNVRDGENRPVGVPYKAAQGERDGLPYALVGVPGPQPVQHLQERHAVLRLPDFAPAGTAAVGSGLGLPVGHPLPPGRLAEPDHGAPDTEVEDLLAKVLCITIGSAGEPSQPVMRPIQVDPDQRSHTALSTRSLRQSPNAPRAPDRCLS